MAVTPDISSQLYSESKNAILGYLVLGLVVGIHNIEGQTTNSGGIAGVVTDSSGAIMPEAVLELRDDSKGTVRTRISDAGLESIGALANLTRLNLDYTPVTDAGLLKLKPLENLEELRLDSATVTDAGVDSLKSFSRLKLLNLYHTLVTEPGYQKLKQALPGCQIIWDRDSSLPTRRGS